MFLKTHKTFKMPNIKALGLKVSDQKIFFMFSLHKSV